MSKNITHIMTFNDNSVDKRTLDKIGNEIKKICMIPKGLLIPTNQPLYTQTLSIRKNKGMINPNAKTQKARGVQDALKYLFKYEAGKYYSIRKFMKRAGHSLITDKKQIMNNTKFPCFARPCPTRPRHGFVDSRVVKNNVELMELWLEVMKEDPKGEILLGPWIHKVNYNAVYASSGSLSIGRGNDGATAGKNSISFPVAPHKFSSDFLSKAALSKKDTVYLEAVHKDTDFYNWLLVQARGGPAISAVSPDYIPKKIVVKHIVKPHNDLLKWEKEAAKFKKGTVVYGNGHTLASHAAIHCVLNKVPFMTSKRPKIGETLSPKGVSSVKVNRKQFKRGVKAALKVCNDFNSFAMHKPFYYSLSVMHNWAYIKHSKDASWLLGSASTLFAKICAALVLGEHRHSKKFLKEREDVYEQSLYGGAATLNKLPTAFKDFYSKEWRSGFGGVPWATCAFYSHSLWGNIVKSFNKTSASLTETEISGIITSMNETTNIAHNNGWWFNKIASQYDMSSIANEPGLAALCVSDIFMNVKEKYDAIKSVNRNLSVPRSISSAPYGRDRFGKLIWLNIEFLAKTPRLRLWSENGKSRNTYVNINRKEYNGLRQKYKRAKKSISGKMFLSVKSNGKFRFPGGKERDIKKVFKAV